MVNLLEQHFPDLVDYSFTARMEDDLDEIAGGTEELVPWLSEFYFGPADANGQRSGGLKEMVSDQTDQIDAAAVNAIPIGLDPDGVLIVAKPGRDNSPYLIRGDDTASIPTTLAPDELTVEKALELLAAPKGGRDLGADPATGLTVYAKTGRFGPYVQLGEYDDEGKTKPKMASLFSTMTVDHIDLGDALELLSLPRVVGVDPADGAEITAQNGRYGPYVQKVLPDGKKDSRSLTNEEQLLTVDARRRGGAVRPAQAAPRPGGQAAAAPAGRGPGQRQADGHQGRPFRALRHRRRDQRLAAQGRRRRDHHRRAGLRAAGRSARAWPGQEGRGKKSTAKKAAKKIDGQEVTAKKATKKSTAKKAAAKKVDGQDSVGGRGRSRRPSVADGRRPVEPDEPF